MESLKNLPFAEHKVLIGVAGVSALITLYTGTIVMGICFLAAVAAYVSVTSKGSISSDLGETKSSGAGVQVSAKLSSGNVTPVKVMSKLPPPPVTPTTPATNTNVTPTKTPPPPVPPRSYPSGGGSSSTPSSPASAGVVPSGASSTPSTPTVTKSLPSTPITSPIKLPPMSQTPDKAAASNKEKDKTLKKKGMSTLRGLIGDVVKGIAPSSSSSSLANDANFQKRKNIAEEILQTERVYVGKLKVIVEVYYIPLKTASTENPHPPLSHDQIQTIFSEIVTIYNYNSHFLQRLEERMKSKDLYLSDLFISIVDFLKSYSVYINNYSKSLAMLESVRKNGSVEQLLQEFASNPACDNLGIESLLIMPVQRIPRYILLLQEMIKVTDKSGSEGAGLQKALNKMKDLASEMNENRREAELLNTMYDIHNRLEGFREFIMPSRRILLDNEFEERLIKINNLTGSNSGVKPSHRRYILCNDILLRTKINGKKLTVKEVIDVNSIIFKDAIHADDPLSFLSSPISPDLISAKSLSDNDSKWKETILHQQKINKENKTSFSVKRDSLHL